MEKILLALNADRINAKTIDFACYIAGLTGSKLTGILLEDLALHEPTGIQPELVTAYAGTFVAADVAAYRRKGVAGDYAASFFTKACAAKNIRCEVHRNSYRPVYDIIAESRFADLLIIDAGISFEKYEELMPTGFVKDVLYYAECPVIVSPENFSSIDEIIFTYDGSASSVFAIKQFTYLFPGLDEKTATVLHVSGGEDWPVNERKLISEWLQPHYSVINFRLLQGKPRHELPAYLGGKKNVMVVMGAFGRDVVSRLIRSSHAEPILKATDLPVFITHY